MLSDFYYRLLLVFTIQFIHFLTCVKFSVDVETSVSLPLKLGWYLAVGLLSLDPDLGAGTG